MRLLLITGLTVVFLIVSINLFVMLVVYLAEDYHVPDRVQIYQLFEAHRYQRIRDKLMRHNYTILVGDNESGVKNFIEHQANIHSSQGRPVVIKRFQTKNKNKQQILKKIKETKFYMELVLGFDRQQRTQVFLIDEPDQLPTQQINFIRQRYPKNNIIIVSERDFNIKLPGFKKIIFPQVKLKQLKQAMQLYYDISAQQAEEIVNNKYRSISRIFQHYKRITNYNSEEKDIIEVEDIQDLNEISQQRTQKQIKRLYRKQREQNRKK